MAQEQLVYGTMLRMLGLQVLERFYQQECPQFGEFIDGA